MMQLFAEGDARLPQGRRGRRDGGVGDNGRRVALLALMFWPWPSRRRGGSRGRAQARHQPQHRLRTHDARHEHVHAHRVALVASRHLPSAPAGSSTAIRHTAQRRRAFSWTWAPVAARRWSAPAEARSTAYGAPSRTRARGDDPARRRSARTRSDERERSASALRRRRALNAAGAGDGNQGHRPLVIVAGDLQRTLNFYGGSASRSHGRSDRPPGHGDDPDQRRARRSTSMDPRRRRGAAISAARQPTPGGADFCLNGRHGRRRSRAVEGRTVS